MYETHADTLSGTLDHSWRELALRGVLSALFGAAAMFWTDVTIDAVVLLFGVCAITDGVVSLVTAMRRTTAHRGWLAGAGIAGVVLGIVAFVWPSITALGLAALIGAWFVVTGAGHVAAAVQAPRGTAGRGVLGVAGAVGALFGAYLVAFPGRGAIALVTAIGLVAIVRGVTLIIAAVASRRELDVVTSTPAQVAAR